MPVKDLWNVNKFYSIPSYAHKQITLTEPSFREGNISSLLCIVTFGTLVAGGCTIFCKFTTCSSYIMILWAV
jgi:hypothetical protein